MTSRPPLPRTTLTARTPEDLLAAVPVVLGFEPRDSVVMLTFEGAETFHARVDLPPPAEADEVAELLLEPARRHRVARVLFVLYGPDGPAARAVVRALRRRFERAGIGVVEVLRAHEGRWFAPEQPGAPAHGTAYDVGGHPFRAQAVVEGIVVHDSRDELAALLEARPEAVAATAEAVRLLERSPPRGRSEHRDPAAVAELVARRVGEGRFRTAELARVLLGLEDPIGRDAAWSTLTRGDSPRHVRLWTDAVQRTPDDLVAGPAAVLGLAAWLAGQGALAWCAVDRCRAVDPDNTLAALVADVLLHAVPPGSWPGPAAHAAGSRSGEPEHREAG